MQIINSVCPHDCPSTCALEVERLDGVSIGRIRGAADNPYTAGVICAKVARYSERIHHPDRLRTPLRRIKDKGIGLDSFIAISWEEALDKVAEQLILAEQKSIIQMSIIMQQRIILHLMKIHQLARTVSGRKNFNTMLLIILLLVFNPIMRVAYTETDTID